MYNFQFNLNTTELLLWALQALLILAALIARRSVLIPTAWRPSASFCLLVIALGWALRLGYEFVLASGGFWYFITDDPCRWGMAYAWTTDPYFLTWDGIWLGGTFYLHGLAMWLIDDPLWASKFVTVLCNLLPLAGMFLFAQGLFRNRLLSCISVLVIAPYWLHLLLGTGSLVEMPMLGLLLGGSGLLLMSFGEDSDRLRIACRSAAAILFFLASAFHYVAWMQLVPILLIYTIHELVRGHGSIPRRIAGILAFDLTASAYMILWIAANWYTFGHPFQFLHNQADMIVRSVGDRPLSARLMQYPQSLAFSIWPILPLAAFGSGWVLLSRQTWSGRARAALLVMAAALGLMIASAASGGTNSTTYRSLTPLSAAVIPFAFAPFFGGAMRSAPVSEMLTARRLRPLLILPLIIALFGLWWLDNHRKTFERRVPEIPTDSNAIALGTWLRSEFLQPQYAPAASLKKPIRIWMPETDAIQNTDTIIYIAGNPGKFDRRIGVPHPDVQTLSPGQLLISSVPLRSDSLTEQTQIGRYRIYQKVVDADAGE